MKKALATFLAIVMVSTLWTSCILSSTFAKYVTSSSSSDSARVAKWGVVIETEIYHLFLNKYKSKNSDDIFVASVEDVLAPGTNNYLDLVGTIKGTPEVAVEVSTVAEVTLENWYADGKYYCPIAFTINGERRIGTQFINSSEFEKWIEDEIAKVTRQFLPGTNLEDEDGINLFISWEWAFEGDNAKDTMLGNADDPATVSISLTQTVVQINGFDTIYERVDEDTILFGSYPQTDVTLSLGEDLNDKIGNKTPTVDNPNGWTSYKYYSNGVASDYMWYIDVEDGGEKYRGVYFTEYRSSETDNISSVDDSGKVTNCYQDNYGYYKSVPDDNAINIYWFRYDPISWTILEESNGEALVLCDVALDSQSYLNEYKTGNDVKTYFPNGTSFLYNPRIIDENGKAIYANNYAYSSVRQWLNGTFYNTAFSNLQKTIITITTVDNSVESTGYSKDLDADPSKYASNDTFDRLFLISYEEASKINEEARVKNPTAYAKAQGAYSKNNNGYWYLRSFNLQFTAGNRWTNSTSPQMVTINGELNVDKNTIGYPNEATYMSIVPALWIKL